MEIERKWMVNGWAGGGAPDRQQVFRRGWDGGGGRRCR